MITTACLYSVCVRQKKDVLINSSSFYEISLNQARTRIISLERGFLEQLYCHNIFVPVLVQVQCGDLECFISPAKLDALCFHILYFCVCAHV